jgi:hypothetical protein
VRSLRTRTVALIAAGVLLLTLCAVPALGETVQVSARVSPLVTASTVSGGTLIQANVDWTVVVTAPDGGRSMYVGAATSGELVPADAGTDYALVMEP